jgi:hypothetical protein
MEADQLHWRNKVKDRFIMAAKYLSNHLKLQSTAFSRRDW